MFDFQPEALLQLKKGRSIELQSGITVRLIRASDLTDIIAMLADEEVNRYLFFAPASDQFYQQFFNPIIENTQQAVASDKWPEHPTVVIRNPEGRYMGMAGITRVMFLNGNFEVGYQLPVHAWGQGIATRTCQLMTQICFEQLLAHKVSADCYGRNTGSYKTLKKCGFVREGCQQDYYQLLAGADEQSCFDDKLYYGMTAKHYQSMNRLK